MAERTIGVGIVGASGALGGELLGALAAARYPVGALKLFGTKRSAGDVHAFAEQQHVVRPYKAESLRELEVVVFATPASASAALVPTCVAEGVLAVDASAALRARGDVPLLVPPLNRQAAQDQSGIVAAPGPLVRPLALVLGRLAGVAGLVSADVVGLLPAGAFGRAGMEELSSQVLAIFNQRAFEPAVFPAQVAFNVQPIVGGAPDASGVTPEERAVAAELGRVLGTAAETFGVTLAVAPVFAGASVALTVRLDAPLAAEHLLAELGRVPQLRLVDERGAPPEHATIVGAAEVDEVLVGRLRVDPRDPCVVRLWLAFDALRSAALNIVRILEVLKEDEII